MPKSNVRYWKAKIARNRSRDRVVSNALLKEGWKVVRIWEHIVYRQLDRAVARILDALRRKVKRG